MWVQASSIGNHFTAVHHFTLEGAATLFNFKLVFVRPVGSTGVGLFTVVSLHPTGFHLKRQWFRGSVLWGLHHSVVCLPGYLLSWAFDGGSSQLTGKEINRGSNTSCIVFTGVTREFQTISKSIKHQNGPLLRCYESKDAHKLVPCDWVYRNNVHSRENYTSDIMKEKTKCII